MSIRFPTQVWIECDDDGVHCGESDCDGHSILIQAYCNYFKEHLEWGDGTKRLRCQACLDEQMAFGKRTDLRKEIVEILKAVEWIDIVAPFTFIHLEGAPFCHICHVVWHQGHTPDCRLKALLDKLKEIENGV